MTFNARGLREYYGLENRSVVLFFLAAFLVQSTMGALNVILNLYILELGFSEDFVGMLLSVKLFTTGLVCIPAGLICTRWGVRRVLLLASAALALGVLMVALTAQPWLLLLGAVAIGAAQATKAVSVPPFLVENSSPQIRQNLFSLNFSLMMFANMVGNALSGYLPMFWSNAGAGYAGTLFFYGIVALVASIPLALIAKGKPRTEDVGRIQLFQGFRDIWGQRNLARLLLAHALIGFGAGLIVPLFNIFMSNKLGASSGEIGVIMSVGQVATALGGLLVPLIVTRLGRVTTVATLRMASIPFLLLIANLPSIYGVGAAYLMRTALMNMTNPVESSFAMELAGSRRVEMSSLVSTMDTATRGISVLAGGWLMARFSYSVPYYFTCALYAVTVLAYWVWFKPMNKPRVGSTGETASLTL